MQDVWDEVIAANGEHDPSYLRLDEYDDVEASLGLLNDALERVSRIPAYWKWAIVAGHNALQSACVCVLTRTDGIGALEKRITEEFEERLYREDEEGRFIDRDEIDWPEQKIASLDELLKRLPGNLAVSLPGRKSTSYGRDAAGDLRRLCEFRNQLLHFPSTSWSLEIADLPRILNFAVEKTEEIALYADFPTYNKFPETQVLQLIEQIKAKLQASMRSTK